MQLILFDFSCLITSCSNKYIVDILAIFFVYCLFSKIYKYCVCRNRYYRISYFFSFYSSCCCDNIALNYFELFYLLIFSNSLLFSIFSNKQNKRVLSNSRILRFEIERCLRSKKLYKQYNK